MRRVLLPLALACLAAGVAAADGPPGGSYLYQPAYCLDDVRLGPAVSYDPQPGDIFLATDQEWWAKAGHWLAGAKGLHHSGIMFRRSDGRMALIEAGPFNSVKIETMDPVAHMAEHLCAGDRVYVRRRCVPLTPEQSCRLTSFAERQDGKPFATLRLLRQITPLRTRGQVRTYFVGRPSGDQDRYFCAELVMESCVAAGLLDAETTRPSATYPRDIFFGHSKIRYLDEHLPLECAGWCVPARWTNCPDAGPSGH
jgi:hypothetical protein